MQTLAMFPCANISSCFYFRHDDVLHLPETLEYAHPETSLVPRQLIMFVQLYASFVGKT